MKIRNGFVSNSSSSSFIVAFNDVPKSEKELQDLLFGEEKTIGVFDYKVPTKDISLIVFNDLLNNKPATKEQITEELQSGMFEELMHYYCKTSWKEYLNKKDILAHERAEKFIQDNIGKKIFIFEYSDNAGIVFSTMEHGEIFSRLAYIWVSKH